jgi:hypothetical protein
MMHVDEHRLLDDPRALMGYVASRLDRDTVTDSWKKADNNGIQESAVLFLLTQRRIAQAQKPELCLLLTKRSHRVPQPGDLCCPGGGIALADKIVSGLLPLPIASVHGWLRWFRWLTKRKRSAHRVMQIWVAGLRESWEEMRLNPLRVSLLGPLPVQQLVLFRRLIFPLAAWVPAYPHLRPNREVSRIVNVPLRSLLDPGNYGRFRLAIKYGGAENGRRNEFPCYIHRGGRGTEILWGATFRITMDFLRIAFGFSCPDMDDLPVVQGRRDPAYFNGSVWDSETNFDPRRRTQ